jgi:glycosyltransferase
MISIITPVKNGELTIKDCIKSVLKQSSIGEHIVVDGASTDSTLSIIRKIESKKIKVISEPDRGLYDAMNKGISLATGDIIGILNSDDFYTNKYVLKKVAEIFDRWQIDSCYGDLQYVDYVDTRKVVRKWKSNKYKPRSFFWGWMPPHPTFFVKHSIYERFGKFNLNLGSAADYELMLRFLVKHRITTGYISEVLVNMRTGGASNSSIKKRLIANRMDRKAWEVNGLKPFPWTTYLKPLRKIGQYFI